RAGIALGQFSDARPYDIGVRGLLNVGMRVIGESRTDRECPVLKRAARIGQSPLKLTEGQIRVRVAEAVGGVIVGKSRGRMKMTIAEIVFISPDRRALGEEVPAVQDKFP